MKSQKLRFYKALYEKKKTDICQKTYEKSIPTYLTRQVLGCYLFD